MFFHKITQQEITKAKINGDTKLFNELCHKYVKQHGSSKFKKINSWIKFNAPILGFYISITALIISIFNLFK